MNLKSMSYSLLALAAVIGAYFVHWSFIALAVILSWLGWRELTRK